MNKRIFYVSAIGLVTCVVGAAWISFGLWGGAVVALVPVALVTLSLVLRWCTSSDPGQKFFDWTAPKRGHWVFLAALAVELFFGFGLAWRADRENTAAEARFDRLSEDIGSAQEFAKWESQYGWLMHKVRVQGSQMMSATAKLTLPKSLGVWKNLEADNTRVHKDFYTALHTVSLAHGNLLARLGISPSPAEAAAVALRGLTNHLSTIRAAENAGKSAYHACVAAATDAGAIVAEHNHAMALLMTSYLEQESAARSMSRASWKPRIPWNDVQKMAR